MKKYLLLGLMFLLGCAPSVTIGEKFVLNDVTCQWAEISASLSSKQLDTLCKDEDGNWELVATAGRPGGQVLSDVVKAGALGFVGSQVVGALGDLELGTTIDLSVGQ